MTERRLAECPLFDDRLPLRLNHAMIDRVAARDGQPPWQPWVRLHAMVADAVQVRGGGGKMHASVCNRRAFMQSDTSVAVKLGRSAMSSARSIDCVVGCIFCTCRTNSATTAATLRVAVAPT